MTLDASIEGARTYAYARQSCDEKIQKNSVDYQVIEAKALYDRTPNLPPWAGYIADIDQKGTKPMKDRVGGRQVLDGLRQGDCLIIWEIDRMGRSFWDGFLVAERLVKAGVKIFIVNALGGSLDLDTPLGKMYLAMNLITAEAEVKKISQRTKAALDRMKASGRQISAVPAFHRKVPLEGVYTNRGRQAYAVVECPKLIAEWKQIQEWRGMGMSARDASAMANLNRYRTAGGNAWCGSSISRLEVALGRPTRKVAKYHRTWSSRSKAGTVDAHTKLSKKWKKKISRYSRLARREQKEKAWNEYWAKKRAEQLAAIKIPDSMTG